MFNSSLEVLGAVKDVPPIKTAVADAPKRIAQPSNLDLKQFAEKQATEVDKAALVNAVKKLNELVAPALQTVQFTIDEELDRVIVKVVDAETKKVLRQIPNEEVLAFSKTLGRLQGLVVRESA
ncbi:MAG: flagellar biosynthesis protein FlaG [Betaproteobacteria bacterium HGW-Betaproteobacteria-22]|nr:MAG: flagellar biosynthesis protein FlaG [Betaproteobacteria bacterium HGW-Betaproteobacteria-22]